MGTRHLIGVVLDNEFKVAQYGQWDGYPSGQGAAVLQFLRRVDLPSFTENVRALRFATPDDEVAVKEHWRAVGADPESPFVTMQQSDEFHKDPRFAALSRDVSADVLAMIAQGGVEFLRDESSFALDGLFCEWAYVVDLDRGVLEVYEGFHKAGEPINGRWADKPGGTEGYAPVHLIAEFSFDALPSDEEMCALEDADVNA